MWLYALLREVQRQTKSPIYSESECKNVSREWERTFAYPTGAPNTMRAMPDTFFLGRIVVPFFFCAGHELAGYPL